MTSGTLSVVPPRRLGALLARSREQHGLTLDDLADRSRFTHGELTALERGDRALTDHEVDEVLTVYGVDATELVPERATLVIDLHEHKVAAGGASRSLAGSAPTADEVLATYLSLVYTLRSTVPGTPLVLRDADVAVLSRALELAQPDVERRLHELMIDADGTVGQRVDHLRSRVLLPVIGVVVAATAVGTLLFVQARDDDPPAAPPAAEVPAAEVPTAAVPGVDIGSAATQSRDADGTSGPVVVQGEDLDVSEIPAGGVGLAEPQVVERDAAGNPVQSTRQAEPTTTTVVVSGADEQGVGLGPASTMTRQADGSTLVVVVQEGPVGDLAPNEVRLGEAQTIENPDL